jgi:hypothetical protein
MEGMMRRAIAFLGFTLLVVGCSKSDGPKAEAPAGRPAADEAGACIVAYLGQCGWQNVQLAGVADLADVPKDAGTTGDAWAYTFSATYTDVFGERRTSESWVAVITRADGKPCLKCCFDESKRLVGGHRGDETALGPSRSGSEMPGIVPPKP